MKITRKHISNRPVTFVTHKHFAVLFFLPSCCVNSLIFCAERGVGSFSFTLTFSLSSVFNSAASFTFTAKLCSYGKAVLVASEG